MKMKKYFSELIILCVALIAFNANSQLTLTGLDNDQANPLNCATISAITLNFTDGAGNYASNMNETVVFCPDLTQGTKVSIVFATNIGFEWNVDPTDTLYVYDGPNSSSPLLGAYNSGTDINGFFVQASFENNPSGCLTLVFHSNGASEGTGWVAHVACSNAPQPFFPHITAFKNGVGPNVLNPIDTGYVDVCFGDSIMFVATPIFPYSFESTTFGYSQNVNNCAYDWTIGGVGTFTNDTMWFTPPARSGYFVDLRITDMFPQIERITCKVRVSQLPSFAGTGPVEDTVCLGQNTNLVGGVTPTDTVGIDIPNGTFQIGGTFAGLTVLPDGTGAIHTTSIPISGFADTTTYQNFGDIDQLCLDIEHSYLGDLEIALTCPNGTMVSLWNGYNAGGGELVPGGCGNGIGTSLGNDTDIDGGVPGSPVWTYCFSEVNATFGTMCAENTAGNWVLNDYLDIFGQPINSMNPNGVYLPDGNFSDFVGCPINGNWTITVQDNQGVDDGYIFQWGLYFNSGLYPNSEGYQNTVVNEFWSSDPTIISGQNDTLLVVQPNTPGNYFYTYNMTDDFGCVYDTTVSLFVMSLPSIFGDTTVCALGMLATGTQAYAGGEWSSTSSNISFAPDSVTLNPAINAIVAGTYTVSFTDDACNQTVSADIYFPPYAYTMVLDTVICVGAPYIVAAQENSTVSSFLWNTGSTSSSFEITQPGDYIVSASNICYTYIDTATIGTYICDINAPNVMVLSSQAGNNSFFVQYDGVEKFNCAILNRWGNTIYEFSDPAGKWDGRTSGGNLVEEGTYFYIIKATFYGGEDITKHGFVQVKY